MRQRRKQGLAALCVPLLLLCAPYKLRQVLDRRHVLSVLPQASWTHISRIAPGEEAPTPAVRCCLLCIELKDENGSQQIGAAAIRNTPLLAKITRRF